MSEYDIVNRPEHYNHPDHPAGVECIEIVERLNYCLGNAFKYLYRAEYKGKAAEDYKKSAWYFRRSLGLKSLRFELPEGGYVDERLEHWISNEKNETRAVVLRLAREALQHNTCSTAYESVMMSVAMHLETLAALATTA